MDATYAVIRKFSGYEVGDEIPIANGTRAAQLLRTGYVVPVSHPSLAVNMALPPPVNAGLLYQLAQMNVGQVEDEVMGIEDTVVLALVVEFDGRAGARAAASDRLAQLELEDG